MANPIRRLHDTSFKTKVVLEALKGHKTLAQLSSEFGLHAQMITDWKRQVRDGLPTLFESGTNKPAISSEQREQIEAPLFQQRWTHEAGPPERSKTTFSKKNYARVSR